MEHPKLTAIVNSEHVHYLYDRWQDEQEYEDWDDYTKNIENNFGVQVVASDPDKFTMDVKLDDSSVWQFQIYERGDSTVGRYRMLESSS
jgi:hypothetical protein